MPNSILVLTAFHQVRGQGGAHNRFAKDISNLLKNNQGILLIDFGFVCTVHSSQYGTQVRQGIGNQALLAHFTGHAQGFIQSDDGKLKAAA